MEAAPHQVPRPPPLLPSAPCEPQHAPFQRLPTSLIHRTSLLLPPLQVNPDTLSEAERGRLKAGIEAAAASRAAEGTAAERLPPELLGQLSSLSHTSPSAPPLGFGGTSAAAGSAAATVAAFGRGASGPQAAASAAAWRPLITELDGPDGPDNGHAGAGKGDAVSVLPEAHTDIVGVPATVVEAANDSLEPSIHVSNARDKS